MLAAWEEACEPRRRGTLALPVSPERLRQRRSQSGQPREATPELGIANISPAPGHTHDCGREGMVEQEHWGTTPARGWELEGLCGQSRAVPWAVLPVPRMGGLGTLSTN